MTTEILAGKTLVIVTAEFYEAVMETLGEKVKSLILSHLSIETELLYPKNRAIMSADKGGAPKMSASEKITALYCRLSRDDGTDAAQDVKF